ncbi:MAG: glycosyltransferase [Bacteroidetes bacterium CHB5]|nr:glycosyltransferase [Bacteroidetes bacterium CHB5]
MTLLFIGNFLSQSSGSYAVSEFISGRLAMEHSIQVWRASHALNRVVRLMEICFAVLLRRYSLVHIDVFSGNSFLFARMAAFIGKVRKKGVLLTLHGGALPEYYQGREKIFQKLFNNTYVQSPSRFIIDFFEKQGFTVAYCPNPVELKNFPYKRTQVRPFSLLWVRAFSEIYNPHMAVQVLQQVKMTLPTATLTMVGPDKGCLKDTIDLITRLGLTNDVAIVGPVKNDELHKYYQSHDVYLNTTSYESFGVAVVEAASCGVPVVSFRVGEIPYLWMDEKNILLCNMGDVEAMANQVLRILNDRALSNQLSVRARERAEEFAWDNIKQHWFKLLQWQG